MLYFNDYMDNCDVISKWKRGPQISVEGKFKEHLVSVSVGWDCFPLWMTDVYNGVENIPNQIGDGLAKIQELDEKVQNEKQDLDKRAEVFFEHAKRNNRKARQLRFESIKKSYYKLLDVADEKVTLADNLYNIVERANKKLDEELSKAKAKLENHNPGITELLEIRSLQLDCQECEDSEVEPQERKTSKFCKRGGENKQSSILEEIAFVDQETGKLIWCESKPVMARKVLGSGETYNIPCADLPEIAAAASTALAATHKVQKGRRNRINAELVKIEIQNIGKELVLSNAELNNVAQQALVATSRNEDHYFRKKRTIMSAYDRAKLGHLMNIREKNTEQVVDISKLKEEQSDEMKREQLGLTPEKLDLEVRYCLCNRISFGEMIACDNRHCPIEWFHFACVGIDVAPKGDWYCPQCLAALKRRRGKK